MYALVDEPGRAQLGRKPKAQNLVKSALMVIITLLGWVIDSANIDNNVAAVQNRRISGADNICGMKQGGSRQAWIGANRQTKGEPRTCIAVRLGLLQQENCEGFVAVEGATMSSNDLASISNHSCEKPVLLDIPCS